MKNLVFYLLIFLFCQTASAQFRFSAESGFLFTQNNEVRAPNSELDQGTLFSFKDDFENNQLSSFFRLEVLYLLNDKHSFEITAAPLRLEYGTLNRDSINFESESFLANETEGNYTFNTYRFSYRYRILNREKLTLDLGASLLIRDAEILLKDDSQEAKNTDLGFVPLLSFELNYKPYEKIDFLLKGDALVGSQGRAEDIFAGLLYRLGESNLKLKAGYRLIEGGADVEQVYSFSFFHFADVGLMYEL